MSSIKSLSLEEKIVAAIACLIGIAFLIFAPKSCTPGATALKWKDGPDKSKTSTQSAKLQTSGSDAKTSAPIPEMAQQDILDPQSSPSTASDSGKNTLNNGLAIAGTALAGQTLVNGDEADTAASTEANSEELSVDNTLLAKLEETEKARTALETEKEKLASDLGLKDETIATLTKEQEQAALLLSQAQAAEAEKAAALEAELEALKQKLSALEAREQEEAKSTEAPQEEAASKFAKSDDDLDESRRSLVIALREMEALRGNDLEKRYQELEKDLNAKSLLRVKFGSGTSALLPEQESRILELSKKVGTEDQFLIVGFADTSGSESSNAALSSARAKSVANNFGKQVGYSRVSAIYLGQTARFGPKTENRVVEIWELKASQ